MVASQYHAQDELGQYTFGYSDPNSARTEVKTADGVVRGAYNYVDDKGIVQTVQYVSDALGYRVAGTNLPVQEYELPVQVVETAEVAAARAEHARLVAEIRERNKEIQEIAAYAAEEAAAAAVVAPVVEEPVVVAEPAVVPTEPVAVPALVPAAEPAPVVIAKAAEPVPAAVPVAAAVVPAPAAAVVPAPAAVPVSTSSQYHAQDELGQYNYGYANKDSAKTEQRLADGSVRGAYRYVDANGKHSNMNFLL